MLVHSLDAAKVPHIVRLRAPASDLALRAPSHLRTDCGGVTVPKEPKLNNKNHVIRSSIKQSIERWLSRCGLFAGLYFGRSLLQNIGNAMLLIINES